MTTAAMVVALVSLTQGGGPAVSGRQCTADAPDVVAARRVVADLIAADNQRALERVVAFYARDAIWLPPEQPPVVGIDGIRARYESLFSAITPEIVAAVDETCVAGDLAFIRGHNGGRAVFRDSNEVRIIDDAYVMLLRREGDGAWRITHLIWHRQSPLKPEAK